MSQNKLIYSVPDVWALQDSRLYLFYQKKGRTNWLKDSTRNIELADGYWPGQLERLLEKGMK